MEEKESKPYAKIESYTIRIKGGDKERVIRLSSDMFRFGVISVILGGLLLIGTAAFSFYSSMRMQRDAATINEIEQAAELRQEQLLTLSKKAATLSETIQNLAQQEQELRIQAGLNPPKEETPPAEAPALSEQELKIQSIIKAVKERQQLAAEVHNGQGGPVEELNIAEVSEALDMLEAKVSTRKESLNDFQNELKQQREQLARGAAMASGYSPDGGSWSASSGSVQFDFANGLPIIPSAGSIPQ